MIIETKKSIINSENIIQIIKQGDSNLVFSAIGRTFTVFCKDAVNRDDAFKAIISEWGHKAVYVDISANEV